VPNVSNGSEVTRAYGNAIGVLEWFCTYTCLKDRGYWSTTTDADNIARARANYENLGQWGSDGATFLSEQQAYIDATQNTLGYHFVLTSASLPNTISNGAVYETSLTWNNKGVSYLYEPARLAFALLNPSDNSVVATHFPETGANPQRLAPGITTEAPTFSFNGVANGSYKLAVGVFRKTTDANPSYNLAITGKTAQGWYPLLENVTVSGSSTYTPRLFTYETEFLSPSHSTGKPNVPTRDVNMSSGMGDRFQATAAGQAISYPIDVTRTGTYHIKLKLKQSSASGKVQLDIDGTNQGGEIDLYAAADNYLEIDLGTKSFASTGTKQFRLTVSGKHASSTGYKIISDAIVLIDASAGSSLLGTSLVTSLNLGTLRNEFTNKAGMRITVGSSPIAVAAIGRMMVSGNSGNHTLRITRVSDSVEVAAVTVSMAGGSAGSFRYADLATPVTLQANTQYYVTSDEVAGGDQWYDNNSGVASTMTAATIDGSVWNGFGEWVYGNPGTSYVGLDLTYNAVPRTSFLTTTTVGTLRNEFTNKAGMRITVGAAPIIVSSLGRIYVSGNSGTHTLRITRVSDNVEVASVAVAMSGGTPGNYRYATLAAPVTLQANTQYYVTSDEVAGGDQWYDYDTTITSTSAATIDGTVWNDSSWNFSTLAGRTYVGIDLVYRTARTYVTSWSPGTLRNEFTNKAGMRITVGAAPIRVYALGRMMVSGNSGSHTLRITRVSDGLELVAVTVSMVGGSAGSFRYADLASPVTLQANTQYYITSDEVAGGDQWYDNNSSIVGSSTVATFDGSVWNGFGEWVYGNPGTTYVGLDFQH
jgi:hypothetical protein